MEDKFIFRTIRSGESGQAAEIEAVCFPPDEACSREMMMRRAMAVPELFLVAEDAESGLIAGFLNGIATNENSFRDKFFSDESLHVPDGRNVMLLGLDVLPRYRRQGLAAELMRRYAARERKNGRKRLVLTCLEDKVTMYKKMGYTDLGLSASAWGGESWHEMELLL